MSTEKIRKCPACNKRLSLSEIGFYKCNKCYASWDEASTSDHSIRIEDVQESMQTKFFEFTKEKAYENYPKYAQFLEEELLKKQSLSSLPHSAKEYGDAESAAREYAKKEYGDYESTGLEGRVKISTARRSFLAGVQYASRIPSPVKDSNYFINELSKWTEIYTISFQFWGEGNNNVYIEKDGVELYSAGGEDSPNAIMELALKYIHKINKVK